MTLPSTGTGIGVRTERDKKLLMEQMLESCSPNLRSREVRRECVRSPWGAGRCSVPAA